MRNSECHRAEGTLLPPTDVVPYPVYFHVTLTGDLCKAIQAELPIHPQQLHRSERNVVQSPIELEAIGCLLAHPHLET